MPDFTIIATRLAPATAAARGPSTMMPIATVQGSGGDAPGPVELLLTAIAGSLLGGVEHATTALSFQLTAAEVRVDGTYGTTGARTLTVEYDLAVQTDEPDGRLLQFHEHVRRSESVQCLRTAGAPFSGRLRRYGEGVAWPAGRALGGDALVAGAGRGLTR